MHDEFGKVAADSLLGMLDDTWVADPRGVYHTEDDRFTATVLRDGNRRMLWELRDRDEPGVLRFQTFKACQKAVQEIRDADRG